MLKTKATIATIAFIFLYGTSVLSDDAKVKETYRASAIALGRGLASELQITITRWTTDEEREALLKTLVEQGQEAMLKILEKQKETGFMRLPNTMGYRIYYAHQIQDGKNRRIVIATNRPISMAEAWRNGRSTDYAITLVQLQLDENNKGEGWMGFAVKLKVDPEKKTLAIENYGTDPVQLKSVRKSN
jgi:hypothetical protein